MKTSPDLASLDRGLRSNRARLGSLLGRVWRHDRWALLAVLGILGLVLGYEGFAQHAEIHGEVRSPWDLAYLVLQLIPMNSGSVPGPVPWQLVVARMLVPLVAGYAAILALAMLFRDQIRRMTLRFARNHVVICGLGRMGSLLTGECARTGMRVVVIELDENNPYIEPARQAGAAVIIGDAMNPEHLRSAGVHRARYLVLLCGEDAINAEIAIRAKELARERSKGVVTCILQISDPALSELLRSYAFALDEASGLRLEILNFYDIAARSVLKSFPALLSMKDGRTPHIIIVGSGHLGTSLILHASLTWRRLGFGAHNRLRVSLVDPEAGRKAEKLTSRYAWLPQLCSLGAHDMDLLAGELDQDPELNDSLLGEDVSGVCVSLDDDAKSLSVGLMLRDRLRGTQVPIIVRMSDNKGLAKLLQAWDQIDEGRSGVHAFPLLENVCQLDLVLGGIHEVLARAIHDNYVRTQTDLGETSATNPSLVSWEQLSEPLRQMNRAQSRDIGAKLRSIGCAIAPLTDLHAEDFQLTPEELESMSQAEHQRWMQDTRAEGFRYGPGPKDPAGKTHPSLVPWSDLSDGEQEKDRVTTRAIPRLLAMAGLQVYRVRPVESRSPPVLPGGQARA